MWLCTAAGALLAVLGKHFFFCTGHTSQFAGLQYTAGFVGFDEFDYARAGALLAANTFGPQVLTTFLVRNPALCCSLSFLLRPCQKSHGRQEHSNGGADGFKPFGRGGGGG